MNKSLNINKKRNFWLMLALVLTIGIVAGWFSRGWVKARGEDIDSSVSESATAAPVNPIVTPNSNETVIVYGGEYDNWQKFTSADYPFTLNYPSGWMQEDSGTDVIEITTPDEKYQLKIAVKANLAKENFSPLDQIVKGELQSVGSLTIAQTPIDKEGLFVDGKSKQYFYAREGKVLKGEKYLFSATFLPVDSKNIKDIDLEAFDYRALAEKTLKSIELK